MQKFVFLLQSTHTHINNLVHCKNLLYLGCFNPTMGHLSCMFRGFHNSSEFCYLDLATKFPVIYQNDDMVPLLWPQNFLLFVRMVSLLWHKISSYLSEWMTCMVSLLWHKSYLSEWMTWFLYCGTKCPVICQNGRHGFSTVAQNVQLFVRMNDMVSLLWHKSYICQNG